jgi:hypothetical protein
VLVATVTILAVPSLGVLALEGAGIISSPLASAGAALVLSVGLAQMMSALWMRHSGSKDLVFGDLMLWGWIKRLRTEKRLSDATKLLGLDRSGAGRGDVFMSPQRKVEILGELAHSLEAGDPFTHGHSNRVTRYAHMIAKTMHLPPEVVNKIRTAASVHDVGKIDTPSEILNKPGKLTDEEYEIMKLHPVAGAGMVDRLGDDEITAIVRHHHERMDGRGYPDKLRGDEIPLGARVIAVADTFDAITSARPYRKARSHAQAIEIIKKEAGLQLDADVVEAFLAYYSGKKALTLWMSFSTAMQRLVAGFGDWVQHARAGGFSGATLSLGAAVTVTAVVGGTLPATTARFGQHVATPVAFATAGVGSTSYSSGLTLPQTVFPAVAADMGADDVEENVADAVVKIASHDANDDAKDENRTEHESTATSPHSVNGSQPYTLVAGSLTGPRGDASEDDETTEPDDGTEEPGTDEPGTVEPDPDTVEPDPDTVEPDPDTVEPDPVPTPDDGATEKPGSGEVPDAGGDGEPVPGDGVEPTPEPEVTPPVDDPKHGDPQPDKGNDDEHGHH